jgi:hypothetical protein
MRDQEVLLVMLAKDRHVEVDRGRGSVVWTSAT